MSTQGKLLIVDDELSVRDSLGKWFREEGYDVTTVENAGDALTRLAEQRWDAALVDIKMHGTDGIELQRRMHEVDPGTYRDYYDRLCLGRDRGDCAEERRL